jgi:hypothetical protein
MINSTAQIGSKPDGSQKRFSFTFLSRVAVVGMSDRLPTAHNPYYNYVYPDRHAFNYPFDNTCTTINIF